MSKENNPFAGFEVTSDLSHEEELLLNEDEKLENKNSDEITDSSIESELDELEDFFETIEKPKSTSKSQKLKEDFEDEDESETSSSENEIEIITGDKPLGSLIKDLYTLGVYESDDKQIVLETEDDIIHFLQKSQEKKASQIFESWKSNLDDVSQSFLTHLQTGGNPHDFLELVGSFNKLPVLDSKESKVSFLKTIYREKNLQDREINSIINSLTDDDIDDQANEYYVSKENEFKTRIQEEADLRAQNELKRQQLEIQKFESIKKELSTSKDVYGFTITKTDKDKLLDFIYKPINDNNQSQLNVKLLEALDDPKKLLAIAKVLSNDFDFSELEPKIKNKLVNDSKNKISKFTNYNSKFI